MRLESPQRLAISATTPRFGEKNRLMRKSTPAQMTMRAPVGSFGAMELVVAPSQPLDLPDQRIRTRFASVEEPILGLSLAIERARTVEVEPNIEALVRTNHRDPSWEEKRFLSWLIVEVLTSWSQERVKLESKRWVRRRG